MMMMVHSSHATLLDHGDITDHGDIAYSPILFTVCRDLSQSAGGPRQLPLPPPGLSRKEGKGAAATPSPAPVPCVSPLPRPPSPRPRSASSLLHFSPGPGGAPRSHTHPAPHLCGAQEIQCESIFPCPSTPSPIGPSAAFHRLQFFKRCARVCVLHIPTPPARRRVCVLRPFQVLPSVAASRSELVEPSCQSLRCPGHPSVWCWAGSSAFDTSSR